MVRETKKAKQFSFKKKGVNENQFISPATKRKQKVRELRQRAANKKKGSARARGYDAKWEAYRKKFLKHNPKCYACGQASNIVDHFIPARLDWDKYFWKADNYLPLCKKCHDTVTGLYDRKEKPDTEGKLRWLANSRKLNDVSVRVKVVPLS